MTFRYADAVKQIVTTPPGTGNFTFSSTPTGYIAFSAIPSIANGDTVPYEAWDGASKRESGYGTWNTGNTITRTSVKQSTAGFGVAENFTAGLTVFCSPITQSLALLDSAGNLNLGAGNITTTGTFASGAAAITGALTATSLNVGAGAGVMVGGTLALGGATIGSNKLAVTGTGLFSGSVTGQGGFASSGGYTDNSGNGITITGFGQTMSISTNAMVSNNTPIQVIANGTGGVILNNGASSWVAASQRGLKKDFVPIANALNILKAMRGAFGVGRYKTDAADAPLRPFVMFEEAQANFTPMTQHAPAQSLIHKNPVTGEIETLDVPEVKGVSLEGAVPLLLAICDALLTEIEALKADRAKG